MRAAARKRDQEARHAEWEKFTAARVAQGLPPYTNPHANPDGESKSAFTVTFEDRDKEVSAKKIRRLKRSLSDKAVIAAIKDDRPRMHIRSYQRILDELETTGLPNAVALFESRWQLEGGYYRLKPEIHSKKLVSNKVIVLGPQSPRKAPKDDLAGRLAEYTHSKTGVDRKKLKALAEANGVWDKKYEKLGDGLARMNVGNRLRAMSRKNTKIVWP